MEASLIIGGMTSPEAVDRYFTEQVVGPTIVVTLGPTGTRRREPSNGALLDGLSRRVELIGTATRSLLSPEPWRALAGTPVGLPELRSARRWVVAAALLAWTGLVAGLVWWWAR